MSYLTLWDPTDGENLSDPDTKNHFDGWNITQKYLDRSIAKPDHRYLLFMYSAEDEYNDMQKKFAIQRKLHYQCFVSIS